LRAMAAGVPMKAANPVLSLVEGSSSKRITFGPVVIQSERRVSLTSLTSSQKRGEKGKKASRILVEK
jgi:hypothetical protein